MSGCIAIEWGTMRLAARWIAPDGTISGEWEQQVALVDLDRAGIAELLHAAVSRWDVPGPIWLSGMIGSAMGWREVPRIACPAGADDIARGCVADRIGGRAVMFVPGLSCTSRFGDPDIMRGEEIAALGMMALAGEEPARLLSVPGMHGKWIDLEGGRVTGFCTSMTVDLHRLLAQHSMLAPLMAAPPEDGDAFARGVARSGAGGGMARLLFAARSMVVAGAMTEAAAASYLWGVLIGADAAEQVAAGRMVHIVGALPAARLFAEAVGQLGGVARTWDAARVSGAGFARLAALAGTQEAA